MEKEVFYQTETINYAAATPAATLYKEITLNSSYERCTGVALFESKTGGISTYRIGIDDKDKQYFSSTHKDLYVSSPQAGQQEENRFLKTNIKAGGHKIKIGTQLPEVLSSDLEYDIVFKLERNAQK